MKPKILLSRYVAVFTFAIAFCGTINSFATPPAKQIYQILVYHLKSKTQEERVDKYLSEAYLPAAHRSGIKTVGVFKDAGIDTAVDKKIYVFLAFQSLKQFSDLSQLLAKDKELAIKGADYINAAHNDAAFVRKESILLEAFSGMPTLKKPVFTNAKSERVYELRSYESASEKQHVNKVQMFNNEEVEIFDRIGSQPVFYGEVLSGSRMPNLMYMTTYSDKKSREEHWKTFIDDPKWKRVSALPEYQNNVSRNDTRFLVPTEYSDL
ncbi:NIPSNAP family protein [Pedobacter foliorum]|uniref:NIPSNAP family protein n=1 Tax=Pedobacter foliorum TaxID=2739058 RepID=UPI0015635B03|nr:NIPSNAP family protein [Pedobacter foliorum]NRF38366.1 NIPSNAP family protein [Pedobacter foliorum]